MTGPERDLAFLLVAWRGDNDLCEGTPYVVARLPEAEGTTITGSYVARARWRRGCFDAPSSTPIIRPLCRSSSTFG